MSHDALSGPTHNPAGGVTGVLEGVATQIREQAAAYCESSKVSGYLAGVYHDGDQTIMAHGTANIVTRAPMRDNTGFLFGSVTKVLTTTLVMQQVERGMIDLDEPVVTYLPEFRLTTPAAAEKVRIRHLLTHTNGIDADLLFVDANGSGALKVFLEELGQHCGVLFEPEEYISYSNGGMIVAGRLLEIVTGMSYHDLLKRELYATVGMEDSSTSAEEAILATSPIQPPAAPGAPTCSNCRTPGLPLEAPRLAPSVISLLSRGLIWPTVCRRQGTACYRASQPPACRLRRTTWAPLTFHLSGSDGC